MSREIQIKCIKTARMNETDEVVFIEGKTYNAITDGFSYSSIDEFDREHSISEKWFEEHFIISYEKEEESKLPEHVRQILEDEKVSLERGISDLELSIDLQEDKLKSMKDRLNTNRNNLSDVITALNS